MNIGVLVVIAIVVIAIFVLVAIFSRKKKAGEMERQKNQAEVEELYARFREAAKSGADPGTVTGFYAIEKRPELKNSPEYLIVKKICMGLANGGYKTQFFMTYNVEKTIFTNLSVYSSDEKNVGEIQLINDRSALIEKFYLTSHIEKQNRDGLLFHIILRLPSIVIISKTSLLQTATPPEWLKICAEVLKTCDPPVTDPAWMKEHPDAKKYINSMF